MQADFIFSILVLLMSVVIHEVSHGYAALALGDRTAEYEGRLTLNPVKHIDLWGSIIFPIISYMLGGFIFGWAKPVPFNPYNLRNQKWGEAIVAIAGPASNLLIAVVFGLGMRFFITDYSSPVVAIIASIVFTNLILAFFNLMPIPPLDGSKILSSILPTGFMAIRQKIEQFGFIAVLLFALVLWQFVTPLISGVFFLLTGIKI